MNEQTSKHDTVSKPVVAQEKSGNSIKIALIVQLVIDERTNLAL